MVERAWSVLVVEDERIVAKDLLQTLSDMGYQPAGVASSGEEAIRRAGESRPDLVLMDIRIKGPMDGIETAQALRDRYDMPVIFLTAHADDGTIDRAKKTEPHGYLLKPVKAAELRSAIEVSIFRHEMERRLRERERWFAATLTSIADAVVAVDRHGHLNFMNPPAEALGGALTAGAVGPGAPLYLSDGNTPLPLEELPITRALAGEVVHGVEVLVGQPGEEQRWLSVTASPVRDASGAIAGAVTVGRDITELRRAVDRLRQAATRDELTGLLNRRGFQEHGARALHLANRTARPLALVFVDLDDMKGINDRFGHAAGDQALVDTAVILRRTFRVSDILARLGGDEFVIIAPDYGDDGSGTVFRERFRSHLEALQDTGARPFALSATLGITVYDPKSAQSLEELLAAADAKMYAAKQRRA